jgi:coiled-coil domain-containing protein 61
VLLRAGRSVRRAHTHATVAITSRRSRACCVLRTRACARADLEVMSAKSGNFKKLAVFGAMLRAALRGGSSTVSLDLLTSADLEALKSRRGGRGGAGDAAPGAASSAAAALAHARASAAGKRYLILTYAAEFDRVHYPLPLLPCEARAVRVPPAASAGTEAALAQLRVENAALRAELASQRAATPRRSGGGSALGASAPGSFTRESELGARLEAAEGELEALGAAHAALRSRAAAESAALTAELAARREGERAWRLKARDLRAEVDGLTRRLRATEARVGLRGAAASANFTYARPGSRPSSASGGSRPASPYAPSSAMSSPRGGGGGAGAAGGPASRSREPSPSHRRPPSRPPSRPTSRPRGAAEPVGRGGSPSASASLGGRFDATAYAAERNERLAAAAALRASFGSTASRAGSPGPASRAASPGGWRSPAQAPASPRWHGGGAAASPRAESPSAALRDVKARLAVFTRGADRPRVPALPTRAAAAPSVRGVACLCCPRAPRRVMRRLTYGRPVVRAVRRWARPAAQTSLHLRLQT